MAIKTIDILWEESGLTLEELAHLTRLTEERVEAIAVGRWTPSPVEREKLAAVFGVSVSDVSWGHTMDPRNVRYRRFGLKDLE